MNSTFTDALVTVGSMIIGIAALSIILSPKARTIGVIQAGASGFSNALGTAMSPVTGDSVHIDTSYPGGGLDLSHFNLSDYMSN